MQYVLQIPNSNEINDEKNAAVLNHVTIGELLVWSPQTNDFLRVLTEVSDPFRQKDVGQLQALL